MFLLQDQYIGQMVRCKKARAMFAMRACRKSVMFGHALRHKQMVDVSAEALIQGLELTSVQIVRHMGQIEQPWVSPSRKR